MIFSQSKAIVAWSSYPSSGAKNMWRYNSICPCVLMLWCLINARSYNSTFSKTIKTDKLLRVSICVFITPAQVSTNRMIRLWGCASKSNTVIMQRSQSKILRAIANAPRYVTNRTVHTDFKIPYVSDVIYERINKHHNDLEAHPNPLWEPLLQPINTRRLKNAGL
jgi:hypothetical protein